MNVEVEPGFKNIIAKKTKFLCLLDGALQAAIRETILTTDVDVAFVRANRIGGDRHRLQDRVRVAFQHDTVLEGAGFAFIRVANDIFPVAMRQADEPPLAPGGEACAAASL